jgi:hypothetical protein
MGCSGMKVKFTLTVSKVYDLAEVFSGQTSHGQDVSAVGQWIQDSVEGILEDPIAFVDQLYTETKVIHEEVS